MAIANVRKCILFLSTFMQTRYYIYRVLVNHVPVLEKYRSDVPWHIPHRYSKEMALKSEIVSNDTMWIKSTQLENLSI